MRRRPYTLERYMRDKDFSERVRELNQRVGRHTFTRGDMHDFLLLHGTTKIPSGRESVSLQEADEQMFYAFFWKTYDQARKQVEKHRVIFEPQLPLEQTLEASPAFKGLARRAAFDTGQRHPHFRGIRAKPGTVYLDYHHPSYKLHPED